MNLNEFQEYASNLQTEALNFFSKHTTKGVAWDSSKSYRNWWVLVETPVHKYKLELILPSFLERTPCMWYKVSKFRTNGIDIIMFGVPLVTSIKEIVEAMEIEFNTYLKNLSQEMAEFLQEETNVSNSS